MNNNHIGTTFAIMKEIADDLGWNYSHGQLTEMGMKSIQVYPMLHVTIQSVSMVDSIATIQINVVIADIMNFLKGENESDVLRTTYEKYGYSESQNYAHILQNLYVAFCRQLFAKEQTYFDQIQIQRPISFAPFIEGDGDVLSGHNITLNMDVINPWVTDGDCYGN
jgi:hypothetical protein